MRGQAWRGTRKTLEEYASVAPRANRLLDRGRLWLAVASTSCRESVWLLVSFPTLIFLVAMADESWRGIQQLNHQLLHVAYNSSYALLLLGLILLLRAILKRKLILLVGAGTAIAAIPLAHIFITQP